MVCTSVPRMYGLDNLYSGRLGVLGPSFLHREVWAPFLWGTHVAREASAYTTPQVGHRHDLPCVGTHRRLTQLQHPGLRNVWP